MPLEENLRPHTRRLTSLWQTDPPNSAPPPQRNPYEDLAEKCLNSKSAEEAVLHFSAPPPMPSWPPPRRPRRKIGDFCERLWVVRRATTHTKGLDLLNSCKLAGQWTELARCSRCPVSGWIRAVSVRCTSADTAAFAIPGLAATATTATKTCEAQAAAPGSSLSASCQAFGLSECRWVGACAYVRTGTRLHALADVSLE